MMPAAAPNTSPQHRALLAQTATRIPAPATWAAVDGPRPPRSMAVTIELLDGSRVSYARAYQASMDAYAAALATYGDDVRSIRVEPLP